MSAERGARVLPPHLLALTPGTLAEEGLAAFLRSAGAAVAAGLTGVLLREPLLADRATLALAAGLRALLDAPAGAGAPVTAGVDGSSSERAEVDAGTAREARRGWLGLHDRVHLAAAARADGVHVGFRSLAPADARAVLDRRAETRDVALGFSSHAGDGPERWRGADYVLHGPVLATPSKAGFVEPVGTEGLERFVARCELSVWGLGGLHPEHAGPVLAAGARGVAVLSGVFSAPDPAAAVLSYLAALAAAPSPAGSASTAGSTSTASPTSTASRESTASPATTRRSGDEPAREP